MIQEKEYFAFISYKREDEKWAKWLQHKLEHYHLPVNVRKENPSLPQTIRPVFKDTSELAAGVLADEIHEALENSKYLIVICSPRSAQSQWVGKEVQTFIELGRTDKIIPFVIGGTPFADNPEEECFPSALLNLPDEQELLGVNINEMGRDAAAIKVIARMFGLKFDTLWQRHEREQRKKRILILGGVVLFALASLAIGGWFVKQNGIIESQKEQLQSQTARLIEDSVTMANHIQRIQTQNDNITRQNTMILQQKDSIVLQNMLILQQRNDLDRTNKQLQLSNQQLAEERDNLKDANNTYSKLSKDLKHYTYSGGLYGNNDNEVKCDYLKCDYHPYEPIVAFSDKWGIWLHYLNSGIEFLLSTDEYSNRDCSALSFSITGEELMAEVAGGEILIWNVRSNKLIQHYEWDDSYRESQEFNNKFPLYHQDKDKTNQIREFSLSINYDCKDNKINIYDDNYKKVCSTKLEFGKDSTFISLYNPKYDELLFITDQKAALYDDFKKEFVLFFKGYQNPYQIEFSESGDYLRIDKDIYTRSINQKIDTIRNLRYTMVSIAKIPKFPKENDSHYDLGTHASLEVNALDIMYKRDNEIKKISVLKQYTMGNGQAWVEDALFAGSDKIIAIVGQGRYRIYNTKTGALMGSLENFIWDWDGGNESFGHENDLCHADSGFAKTKFINKKLYVISTGGIIRIYNVDQYRLETVIELPFERSDHNWNNPIDVIYFADDGSRIYYSIKDDPFYYMCELPEIK